MGGELRSSPPPLTPQEQALPVRHPLPHPLPLTHLTLAFVGDSILKRKGHCVVCVAEGAGQDILDGSIATDLSGNPVLGDIGTHLRDLFRKEFKGKDVKYIDPSYMIRSIPTTTTDRKVYWPRPPRARPDSLTRATRSFIRQDILQGVGPGGSARRHGGLHGLHRGSRQHALCGY